MSSHDPAGHPRTIPVRERIRSERNKAGISLSQLASATGISKAYLVRLETDPDSNPSLAVLGRIADALDITVADLVGRPKLTVDESSLRAFADEVIGALDALAARLQAAEEERDEYMQQWADVSTLEFLDYWQTIGRSCSAGEAIRQLLTEKQAAEERVEKAEEALERIAWHEVSGIEARDIARSYFAAQETNDPPPPRDSGISSA